VLVDGLNAIPGVRCPKPSGAFYCMAELPVDDSEKFCQWILESYDYQGRTVMMAPASGFYATQGLGKNQVRMAYVLNVDALKHALVVLKNALEAYPGRVAISEKMDISHS
jgi:aspartate aminotransferase